MQSWTTLLLFLGCLCQHGASSHSLRRMGVWTKAHVASLGVLVGIFATDVSATHAVSGGGKDFATKDIRGQNFDGQKLMTKDFTQADATGASFKGAQLQGSRFYRANLKDADFTNADLSTASLEDTSLQDVIFTNARLEGAYFSASVIDVKSIEGADFTDALMPDFAKSKLCARTDIYKAHPQTSVVTADSLFCQ